MKVHIVIETRTLRVMQRSPKRTSNCKRIARLRVQTILFASFR